MSPPFPIDRPYQFFESTSCSIALSRLRSATSFFRFAFSSSSCLSFFISLGIMPPYFFSNNRSFAQLLQACGTPPPPVCPVLPALAQTRSAPLYNGPFSSSSPGPSFSLFYQIPNPFAGLVFRWKRSKCRSIQLSQYRNRDFRKSGRR